MKKESYIIVHSLPGIDQIDFHFLFEKDEQVISTTLEKTDTQHVLATVMDALAEKEIDIASCRGIGLIQEAQRFTVARLAGVLVNALGWSLRVPVVLYDAMPSYTELVQEIPSFQYSPLEIGYTAEPTIHTHDSV